MGETSAVIVDMIPRVHILNKEDQVYIDIDIYILLTPLVEIIWSSVGYVECEWILVKGYANYFFDEIEDAISPDQHFSQLFRSQNKLV